MYFRFSTLTACLSSTFLSGPFHGKFYDLLETITFSFVMASGMAQKQGQFLLCSLGKKRYSHVTSLHSCISDGTLGIGILDYSL